MDNHIYSLTEVGNDVKESINKMPLFTKFYTFSTFLLILIQIFFDFRDWSISTPNHLIWGIQSNFLI